MCVDLKSNNFAKLTYEFKRNSKTLLREIKEILNKWIAIPRIWDLILLRCQFSPIVNYKFKTISIKILVGLCVCVHAHVHVYMCVNWQDDSKMSREKQGQRIAMKFKKNHKVREFILFHIKLYKIQHYGIYLRTEQNEKSRNRLWDDLEQYPTLPAHCVCLVLSLL